MGEQPLVSVGIPAYNRSAGLIDTLEHITAQTYANVEIIISDNASPDPKVAQVVREYISRDERIQYYRQDENKGAPFNFLFVLEKSHGQYFMWAADDDLWEDFYIEELVSFLEDPSMQEFVAANFEAQYIGEDNSLFEYFPEGTPFYNYQSTATFDRLMHMLKFNYGNIIYSLYRRDVLERDGLIFAQNEIPFLLQVSQIGNWKVLPKVGFYKRTILPTYIQARWEMEGGWLNKTLRDNSTRKPHRFIFRLLELIPYHQIVLRDIKKALDGLDVNVWRKIKLKMLAQYLIGKHLLQLSWGFKRKHNDRA